MRRIFVGLIAVLALVLTAKAGAVGFNDAIDRTDPHFVEASLLVIGPGEELFSCVGHVCIRLECRKFGLDYCFSYESERAVDRLPTFFAGRLRMGLFAIPTTEFLKEYDESGRGVVQYAMNLPPVVKQRLWRILDNKAAEGANLPYDYNRRGCAKSAYACILLALESVQLETSSPVSINDERKDNRTEKKMQSPETETRREKFCRLLAKTYPWNLFVLHAIVGTEVDNAERIVVPQDLLSCLQRTRIAGIPIIADVGKELLSARPRSKPSVFTPMTLAVALLALSVLGWFRRSRLLAVTFLVGQTLLGVFFTYMMTASGLPTSCWNWLIIPFNPFPMVLWRWRKRWALPFAVLLIAWEAFMLLSPHPLTDPAWCVIVMAYVIFYFGQRRWCYRCGEEIC